MEYRIVRSNDDNIEHGLFNRKGTQNKNHKYLARLWIKDRWRYAYTQAELKALQNFGRDFHGNKYSRERELELNRQRGELTDKLYNTEKKIINSTFDEIKKRQNEKKIAKVKKTVSKGPKAVAKEVSKSVTKALKNAGVYGETKQLANEIKSATKSVLKPIKDAKKQYEIERSIKKAKKLVVKKSKKFTTTGKKFVDNLFNW